MAKAKKQNVSKILHASNGFVHDTAIGFIFWLYWIDIRIPLCGATQVPSTTKDAADSFFGKV